MAVWRFRPTDRIKGITVSLYFKSPSRRHKVTLLAEEPLASYEQIESPSAERVRRKLVEWQR